MSAYVHVCKSGYEEIQSQIAKVEQVWNWVNRAKRANRISDDYEIYVVYCILELLIEENIEVLSIIMKYLERGDENFYFFCF